MKINNSICCLCVFASSASYIGASQSSSSVVSSAGLSVPTRSYFTSSSHHRQLDVEQLGVSLQPIDNESPIAERVLRAPQTYSGSQETGNGLVYHRFAGLGDLAYTFGDFKEFKKIFDQLKPYKGSGSEADPYCWAWQNSLQEYALALVCLYAKTAGPWCGKPEAISSQSFKQTIEPLSQSFKRAVEPLLKQIGGGRDVVVDLRQYFLFVFWMNDNGEKISDVLKLFRDVVLGDLAHSWMEEIIGLINERGMARSGQDAQGAECVKAVADPVEWVDRLERKLNQAAALYETDMGVSKISQERANKPSFSSYLLSGLASELHKAAKADSSNAVISQWFSSLHTAIMSCQKLISSGFQSDFAENSLRSGGESPRSMPSIPVNGGRATSPFGGSLRSFGANSGGSPQSPHRILALSPHGSGMPWGTGGEHGTSAPQSSHAVPSVRNESELDDAIPYQAISEQQGLVSRPQACWLKRCFNKYPKVMTCLATLMTAGVGYGAYCVYAYTSWFHR